MSDDLLNIHHLRVYFPVHAGLFRKVVAEVKAVNGVDLQVKKQEVLGLVGESGSGKSTIGRAALDLIKPTSGTVEFLGKNLALLNKEEKNRFRQEAQIIFQDPFSSLNPRKSVGSAIGEALLYHHIVKSAKEQKERVVEALEKVGLSPDIAERYPHQFSGGQQQRICIARAIVLNPKLIVCDEAVSALDVSIQAQILNLLGELKEKLSLSYLFISHDLSIIRHISDRVAVLYLGKVMETASAKELFDNPKHPYTQALLSSIPKPNPGVKKTPILLKGQIPSPLNPPSGCPFRTRCPYAQEICKKDPPLKTVKDALTGQEDHSYSCIL